MSLTEASKLSVDSQVAGVVQLAHLDKIVKNGRVRVAVNEDGLSPDVCRGDVVTFVPINKKLGLRKGDVVFFKSKARAYLRRFHCMEGNNLVLRDCVGYEDTVTWSDIIGRAVRIEREGIQRTVRGVQEDVVPTTFMGRVRMWLNGNR